MSIFSFFLNLGYDYVGFIKFCPRTAIDHCGMHDEESKVERVESQKTVEETRKRKETAATCRSIFECHTCRVTIQLVVSPCRWCSTFRILSNNKYAAMDSGILDSCPVIKAHCCLNEHILKRM